MYLHNMNIQIPTFTVDMGILLQKGHLMEIKLSLSIMLANWVLLLTYVKVDFLIIMLIWMYHTNHVTSQLQNFKVQCWSEHTNMQSISLVSLIPRLNPAFCFVHGEIYRLNDTKCRSEYRFMHLKLN